MLVKLLGSFYRPVYFDDLALRGKVLLIVTPDGRSVDRPSIDENVNKVLKCGIFAMRSPFCPPVCLSVRPYVTLMIESRVNEICFASHYGTIALSSLLKSNFLILNLGVNLECAKERHTPCGHQKYEPIIGDILEIVQDRM